MSMTTPVPEGTTNPVSPYAGLPKPPMAPPLSKATAKVPIILSSVPKITFPTGMGKYLERRGIALEMLQFDTVRLLVGSVRGGKLAPHESGTP